MKKFLSLIAVSLPLLFSSEGLAQSSRDGDIAFLKGLMAEVEASTDSCAFAQARTEPLISVYQNKFTLLENTSYSSDLNVEQGNNDETDIDVLRAVAWIQVKCVSQKKIQA